MIFQVQSYNIQDVISSSQPDVNLDNILEQLNNRTVWIIDRPLKNGDTFEVTDPALIKYLQKQYIGTNQPWLVVVADEPTIGSSPELAIDIIVDAGVQDYALKGGEIVWLKFTPSYSDEIDFYICSNGLFNITNDFSNYNSYESDATTPVDISSGNSQNMSAGEGPDSESRETWSVFLNFDYQSGQTYYVSFVLPFDGTYGFVMLGD